jgi:hypothetical protein
MATKEQYQAALDVLHEVLPMQIQKQRRGTGEWMNLGACVRGQEAAYARMAELREGSPKAVFRVLPKNEADKYREGLQIGRKLGPEEDEPRRRRPTLVLPDNL